VATRGRSLLGTTKAKAIASDATAVATREAIPGKLGADDRAEAGVGEENLEHLGGQIRPGDHQESGGGVTRPLAHQPDPAGDAHPKHQRRRVAEASDDRGQRLCM
jgi:hypothetical protein